MNRKNDKPKYWNKPEEFDQLMAGLTSIRELMNNGMFQLDEETEQEMVECGAIEMDVEEMEGCLDEGIKVLEDIGKLFRGR